MKRRMKDVVEMIARKRRKSSMFFARFSFRSSLINSAVAGLMGFPTLLMTVDVLGN